MIDNYDSFTYNLVQYFSELDCEVVVHRNDQITLNAIRELNPDYIVISPGPCTPNEAGISLQVIEKLGDEYPILGVCLGHQSIAQAFGGKVVHADEIMHGKVSEIIHDGTGLYQGLPSPLSVTRYHSLIAEDDSLPDCLQVTAWVRRDDGSKGAIMSFAHQHRPIYGVQYHPESILTMHGKQILKNFLNLSQKDV
ncbi:MAG: anthranilate/aminodeoxychorismate synthase component II [Gammaproteobacteria bacterium]|nr:MAG: anthranilate/aminodeoxychorismate synthase component II [Gammaproteobacteria bacterium]